MTFCRILVKFVLIKLSKTIKGQGGFAQSHSFLSLFALQVSVSVTKVTNERRSMGLLRL